MKLSEEVKKARAAKKKAEQPVYLTYEDYPVEDLYLYAGLDNIATSTVLARIFPMISEEPLHVITREKTKIHTTAKSILEVNNAVTLPALEYILDMEINGLAYDVEMNKRLCERITKEIAELEAKIFAKIPKFNIDSGKLLTEYIYETCGLPVTSRTQSGEPSTDGEALLVLAGLDPMKPGDYITPDPNKQWLAHLAKRKDLNSIYNTFLKNYVGDFVKPDGRIHPNYNLHGTSGFRISGDNPNLTQLPRPKHGYNIRTCYTVEKGYFFMAFDFSSAEVKILGALCKDPNMLKAIREGLDFHSYSASSMIKVSYEDFMAIIGDKTNPKFAEYKNLRQTAKILTFSLIYGSSEGGIAMQLNIPVEEASRLISLYFTAFPGIKQFVEESHAEARDNFRIITPFGQRRQEYGAMPIFQYTAAFNAAFRNAQNVRVQSPTSTLGLITFAALNKELKKLGAKATCTVYDSCEFEVPIEHAAKAVEIAFYYLNDWPVETFDWLDLPIGVEGEIGFNWGELDTVHRGETQAQIEAKLEELKPRNLW